MSPLTALDKEELRHAALEVLVARHPTAHPLPAIRRHTSRAVAFKFADDDLQSALAFLVQCGLIITSRDGLGSSEYWVATSAGVLAVERGKVPDQAGGD